MQATTESAVVNFWIAPNGKIATWNDACAQLLGYATRDILARPLERLLPHSAQQRLAKLTLGDPLQRSTDIGPLARADLRDNLARQVSQTLEAGARCVFQSEVPAGDGFFYPVTLLADVSPDMCAFREETFGPVMVVTAAENIDQALQLANDTDYGLGAAIWSSNQAHIQRAINELQAGQVAVNGIVKTDSRLPSGGIKGSGIGRELGPQGILEFVNAKQVWIK